MHSGRAVQIWVGFKDVIYIINMSSSPEAERIWKGEVHSNYYWAWQNNELSPKIESFLLCVAFWQQQTDCQGWDGRDFFLLPIPSCLWGGKWQNLSPTREENKKVALQKLFLCQFDLPFKSCRTKIHLHLKWIMKQRLQCKLAVKTDVLHLSAFQKHRSCESGQHVGRAQNHRNIVIMASFC